MAHFVKTAGALGSPPPGEEWLRLSTVGYFADFVIYPLLILAFALAAVATFRPVQLLVWAASLIAGLAIWSLLEYVLHRGVLHGVPTARRMHDAHHAEPSAMVGTPSWLTLAIFVGTVFLPLFALLAAPVANGLSSGLMAGYLWFIVMHYAVHHRSGDRWRYLRRAKRRHARHHHAEVRLDYGVTTGLWDRLFGTSSRQ